MSLKAYMVFDRIGGPHEGAGLAFAHTAREAKRRAFPLMRDWFDSGFVDVAVRWMRNDAEWLAEQEGVDLEGEPKVIESPKFCQRCELWGTAPLDDAEICEDCQDEEDCHAQILEGMDYPPAAVSRHPLPGRHAYY